MSRVGVWLAIGVVLFAAPVRAQVGSPIAPVSADPAPLSALSTEADLNYQLGPDDKVRIITYDEPQLTGQFSVNSSGNISLPLIGEVKAVGRTVLELRANIETLLRQGYIKNPSVSVEVLTFRPFYILGEINKPGEYPYTDKLTVLNAVATAGGFTYRANQHMVYIKHQADSGEVKTPITAATEVRPGDTIRVGERYF